MNRGWKRGVDLVPSPRASENFNSPTSPFKIVNISAPTATILANPWDFILYSAPSTNLTITLPQNPVVGDQVKTARFTSSNVSVQVNANTAQTINGVSSITIYNNQVTTGTAYQFALFEYMGAGLWLVTASTAGDLGLGFYVKGTVQFDSSASFISAAANFNQGTNTAPGATVTTPTLGAAAQLAQTTKDSMVYITVTTAGTLTIAIGATSGVANTIVAGLAAPLGAMYTLRLPAAWYIAVTTGTTAAWTATAIGC